MISDNGTNFVGGNNELKQAATALDLEKVKSFAVTKHVEWTWTFITSDSPHKGGIWERMVRAIKRVLKAIY